MKKSLILLTALCATPAFADNTIDDKSNFYITGSIGVNYGDTVDGEGNIVAFKGYGDDTGGSYTLGLGYKYSEQIRIETRFSHKKNKSEGTKNAFSPGVGANIDGTVNGKLSSNSLTVDMFYDFTNNTKFTPYVKGGLGLSRNAYKVSFDVPAFGPNPFQYGKNTSTEFTWNVGVGASYELTPEWAVFTEYQIQNLSEVSTKKDSFGDRWVNDSYWVQEVNVGVRYRF